MQLRTPVAPAAPAAPAAAASKNDINALAKQLFDLQKRMREAQKAQRAEETSQADTRKSVRAALNKFLKPKQQLVAPAAFCVPQVLSPATLKNAASFMAIKECYAEVPRRKVRGHTYLQAHPKHELTVPQVP